MSNQDKLDADELATTLKALGMDVVVVDEDTPFAQALIPVETRNWEVEEFILDGQQRAYIEFDGRMSPKDWTRFVAWMLQMVNKVAVG